MHLGGICVFRAILNDIHISISTREKLRSKIQVYIYIYVARVYVYVYVCVTTCMSRFLRSHVTDTLFKFCSHDNWDWNLLFTSSVFISLLDFPRSVRPQLLSRTKLSEAFRDYVNYYYYRYYLQRLSRNASLGERNVVSRYRNSREISARDDENDIFPCHGIIA